MDDRAGPDSQVRPVLADLSVRSRTGTPTGFAAIAAAGLPISFPRRDRSRTSLLITMCGDKATKSSMNQVDAGK